MVLGPLGAQNGNGNAGSNNPNGNNRAGDKNQPNYARGFDISDSRISDRGRDRREMHLGKGHVHWPNSPAGIKLDWNYDVGGGGTTFNGPYPVNGAPAKWNFLFANQTTGDNASDRVYVATNAVAGQTQSDQFSSSALNPNWYFRDSTGTSSYSLTANPGHLQISVPGGFNHDCWGNSSTSNWFNCSTMLQTAQNVNATYETKIDGTNLTAASNGHSYGIMVWQDDLNYLLFEYFTDTTGSVKIDIAKVIGGVGTIVVSASVTLGASNYIRVTRSSTTYTLYYSQDGTTWTTVGSLTQTLTVNRAGLVVSNYNFIPAVTGNFDYFTVTGETPRYKVFNFHNEVTELTANDKRADEAIADVSEITLTQASVPLGTGDVQLSPYAFVTSRGNPGVTAIPAGTWEFRFSAFSSILNNNTVFVRVYKRNLAGADTLILQSPQTALLGTSAGGYQLYLTIASPVSLLATDRLVFKYFATLGTKKAANVSANIEGSLNAMVFTTIPANNVYAFSDIYNTVGAPNQQPLCLWQKAVGNGAGKADGSSVTLSLDGSRIYFGSTDGKVYCLNTADGSTVWSYDTFSSIRNATPFYDYASDQIWIGSEDGRLHKIDGINGTLIAKSTSKISSHATQYAIHSTPIRYSFGGIDVVLVGADDGKVYRVDPNNLNALIADSGANTSYNLTSSGTTAAADAIWGTPMFDVDTNNMVVAVNGVFYNVNLITGAKSTSTLFAAGSIMYSSPAIDWDNNFVYVGGGKNLWKLAYLTWTSPFPTPVGNNTAGTNPDNTYPRSSPLWVSGTTDYMYIGDGGGFLSRFVANNMAANPLLSNSFQMLPTTADSDSPIIMDYFTGNIYFGATNGRLYQLSQTF
jgi:outer membrane protein assembly factor BamB